MGYNRQVIVLNTAMFVGLALVFSGVVTRFVPQWQPLGIIVVIGLIALEGGIVHHTFRRNRMWFAEFARYLLPELLLMAVAMRVATSLSLGDNRLAEDARRWLFDPLSIFDIPFLLALVCGLIVGGLTHSSMQALRELSPQEFERALDASEDRARAVIAQDRATALRTINTRFVVGGVLVFLSLGLEAANIQNLNGPSEPISLMSSAGALTYLIGGFLLYSQARLALLQTRWRLDGAEVSETVSRRWTRSSWLIIASIALAAVLLPRTYGLGLLDTIQSALGVVGYIFTVLGYMVIWLFSLLALIPAWLLSLFTTTNGQSTPPAAPPLAPPPIPEEVRTPQLLPALVFWACMLLLLAFALLTVLQRHPLLAQRIVSFGPLARLLRWLGLTWRGTRTWASNAAHVVRERLRRPVSIPARRGRLIRLGGLSPQELVRYFYGSTLRRAADSGIPRKRGQTPYEYRATLASTLPDADTDIDELTEAFVKAQYSPRPVAPDDAKRVRPPWQRLRRLLRERRPEPQQDQSVDE